MTRRMRVLAVLAALTAVRGFDVEDSVSLIQFERKVDDENKSEEYLADDETTCLVLDGSGWAATATQAAVLAVLAKYLIDVRELRIPTHQDVFNQLLGGFDIIASVGEGSQLAGQLIYSDYMLRIIMLMGFDPESAGFALRQFWFEPYFNKAGQLDEGDVAGLLGWDESAKDFDLGEPWVEMVKNELNLMARVEKEIKLSATPNDWAMGKKWVAGVSLPTPGNGHTKDLSLFLNIAGDSGISYKANSETSDGHEVPGYVPARISVVPGEEGDAPLSFCAMEDCGGLEYTFSGGATTTPGKDLTAIFKKPGDVSLASVISASSASGGWGAILPDAADKSGVPSQNKKVQFFHAEGSPAEALDEEAAKVISGLAEGSSSADALSKFHAVVDGSFTDATGVATALGAGATHITIIHNTAATEGELANLFKASEASMAKRMYPQIGSVVFPVFEESSMVLLKEGEGEDADMHKFTFEELKTPQEFLTELYFRSIKATTVTNTWFGIEEGKSVTLNIFFLKASLDVLKGGSDFTHLSDLITSLAMTMTSHANIPDLEATYTKGFSLKAPPPPTPAPTPPTPPPETPGGGDVETLLKEAKEAAETAAAKITEAEAKLPQAGAEAAPAAAAAPAPAPAPAPVNTPAEEEAAAEEAEATAEMLDVVTDDADAPGEEEAEEDAGEEYEYEGEEAAGEEYEYEEEEG